MGSAGGKGSSPSTILSMVNIEREFHLQQLNYKGNFTFNNLFHGENYQK
jgi:hypothetical protein